MKYQVWIKAHDPKTLVVIAETLVFENEDRLECEKIAESCTIDPGSIFGPVVWATKVPLYTTETRTPGWGALVEAARVSPTTGISSITVVAGSGGVGGGVSPAPPARQCRNSDCGKISFTNKTRCPHCSWPL